MRNSWYLPLFLTLIFLVGCSGQPPPEPTVVPTQEADSGRTIVIGDISGDPDAASRFWQPLADYLAANLDEFDRGDVYIASDLDEMVSRMNAGEVDVYIDSPYPSLYVSDQSGGQIALRNWDDGVSEYHSVFFTLDDAGVETIEDLTGKIVAMDTPVSTSGYFLPTIYLKENGYTLAEVSSVDGDVASDTVGYIFSDGDINTVQWVMNERVTAGVVDNITYLEIPEEARARMTIVAETNPVARKLVTYRPGLDEDSAQAITDVLADMENTASGPEVLEAIESARFDPVPGGVDAFRQEMEALLEIFQADS